MPIDPNDPNLPNDPKMDVSKYLNFDELRQRIDVFFAEMLDQLQTPLNQAMKDMEKSVEDSFKEVGKKGEGAFDKVGESGKSAFKEVSKVASDVFSDLSKQAKTVLEQSDFKQIEHGLLASRQAVNRVIEKEDAEYQKVRMEYLKEVLSKEEYGIMKVLAERDKFLEHIEDEYVMQRNNINAEIKDQQRRNQELIKLDDDRERKKRQLRQKYADKEREIRGEVDIASVAKKKFSKDVGDIGTKMLGLVKNLNFITLALGAALAVFNMGVKETQRSARLLTVTRGALGAGPQQQSGRNIFDSLLKPFADRGVKADAVEEYVNILAEAPQALKEAASKDGRAALLEFTDVMKGFGVDTDTSMRIVASASRDWNSNISDLSKTMKIAIGINKSSGLGVKDAFNSLLNLNAQLRSLTFSSREAAKVMVATASPLKEMGFRDNEIDRFTQSLTQMLASFSPSKVAGLFALTKGRMPERSDFEKMSKKGGQLEMVADTFLQVIGDKLGTSEGLFMIEGLGKQLGFSAVATAQGALAWEKILMDMKSGSVQKSQTDAIEKQMKDFEKEFVVDDAAFKRLQMEGFAAMKGMKSPMEMLGAKLGQLTVEIGVKLVPAITTLNSVLQDILSSLSLPSWSQVKQQLPAAMSQTAQTQFPLSFAMYNMIKKNLPREASREQLK